MDKDLTSCHTINIYEIAMPLHAFHQSASKSNSWDELLARVADILHASIGKAKQGSKLVQWSYGEQDASFRKNLQAQQTN